MKKFKRHMRIARLVIYKETAIDFRYHCFSFAGAFMGISLIGILSNHFLPSSDTLFLIGSFGATSVLVYGAPNSPLAQPRNVVLGHFLCAMIGVGVHQLIPWETWLAPALTVALCIVVMQATKSLHPPAGATGLIAIIGSEKVKHLGFLFVLSPVLSGVAILMIVALLFNNLNNHGSYPVNRASYKIWKKKLKVK